MENKLNTQENPRVPASRRLRFGLIGAGGIAQAYAQAFNESECCDLVAVADVRIESAAALGRDVGGTQLYRLQALPKTKANWMRSSLRRRRQIASRDRVLSLWTAALPVLCEKPLCPTVADAEKMIAAAEKAGVLFTMASKFRYCDDVIKAKGILASGVLGDVLQFENAFTAKVDMSKRWNSDARVSGGGVLIDNGTHSVDIIRYFLGRHQNRSCCRCRRNAGPCRSMRTSRCSPKRRTTSRRASI